MQKRCIITKRIGEDHKRFRDVVSGRTRKQLRRLIKSGGIVKRRGKNGKMTISIPRIDIPHIVFGNNGEGVGRGPGKEGDIIGKDPGKGKAEAGEEHADGIMISLDMEDVLKFMKDELQLPEMKPKPNETFDEVKIKYSDISKIGPESLRHTRRTMLEAIKRLAQTGELDKPRYVPSSAVPLNLIMPVNSDRRYRQYREVKVPSSNAVIFFARDCSGSMDAYRCEIVSDMCWWIDTWIRQYYKKVDRCYFIHDTLAEEVDEEKFYKYRQGGGTQCSSVFNEMSKQLENRYPPSAYNVYIFYFTDGDNWDGDNKKVEEILKKNLVPNSNLIGITQVCPWGHGQETVKGYIDKCISSKQLDPDIVVTAEIGETSETKWGYTPDLSDEDRNLQIIDAVKRLLGKERAS